MPLSSSVIDALVAAGCTAEQLAAAVKADGEEEAARAQRKRDMAAARKRRQRESEASHAMSRGQGVTDADRPSPKKEIPPTPPKEKTPPSLSEASASSSTPRDALERVLDPARAAAVVDHRKRIGKPLTAYAAGLLAKKFALCPDPDAAADEMVSNGWQGFKPDWMNRPRAGPAAPKRGMDAVFGELEGFLDGQGSGEGGDETPQGAVLSVPYRHADG